LSGEVLPGAEEEATDFRELDEDLLVNPVVELFEVRDVVKPIDSKLKTMAGRRSGIKKESAV
jgi:hypothetical protein